MSVDKADFITLPKFLAKLPSTLVSLPRLLKGLKMVNESSTTKPLGLGLLFEQAVEKNPEGVAVYFEDTQITYREFNRWSNRVAHYLEKQGLKKGDTVTVFIENRIELLVTVIALAKLGVVSSMVNTSLTGKVLEYSVNLVNPKKAIVGQELTDAFDASFENISLDRDDCFFVAENAVSNAGQAPQGYHNLFEIIANESDENPASTQQVFLNDPLFYIYTSGTTGLPKATVFNNGRYHRAVGAFGHCCMNQGEDDVMYVPLPFYHSTAMVVCWGGVLAGGASLALRRNFSVSNFWDDCRKYGVTGFGYVGEICRYLFDNPESPDDRNHKVYKMVGNGIRPQIWKQFKERFGITNVYEFYASSEGNIGFTNLFNFDNTVGFTSVKHVLVEYDLDTGEPLRGSNGFCIPVRKGEDGLLLGLITDSSPYDGYTDPEKTKKTIVEDGITKGDRWFNTGDVMRKIGFNHAQFVDRLGDTFRWKGENVSTNEVESVLHDFEQVEDCVVYGVEIPNTNGRAGMVALNLNVSEEEFDRAGFLEYAKKNLPSYAVPIFFRIRKEHVEMTGSFKYKKSDLQNEAYYADKCRNDALYVLLPKDGYTKIDASIEENIDAGLYRL